MQECENNLFNLHEDAKNNNIIMWKLIDLLVTLNMSPDIFITSLIESQTINALDNLY